MKCFFCGGTIIWDSDADEPDNESKRVISFFTCKLCGRIYEVSEPYEEDKKTCYQEYWCLHKKIEL